MTIPRLAPAPRRPLARYSRFLVDWDARHLRIDAETGQLGAGTFAASANLIATDGTTFAAVAGMPRWQVLDLEAGIAGRESPSLWLGTGDTLALDTAPGQADLTLAVRFVQPSSFPAAGKGILYLGNDGVTGARFYIDSTGTQYRVTYHNGTSSVTSTMTGTAPTSGQVVLLRATRDASGRVQIHQTKDAAAETSATQSGTLAIVAFPASTRLRLNGIGTANTTAFGALRAWLAPGTAWTPSTLTGPATGTIWLNDRAIEEFGLEAVSFAPWWDPVGIVLQGSGLAGQLGIAATDRGLSAPPRRLSFRSVLRASSLADRLAKLDAATFAFRGLQEVRLADDPERVGFGRLEATTLGFRGPQMVEPESVPTFELVCDNPAKYDRRHRLVIATGTAGAAIPCGSLAHRGRLWVSDTLASRTVEVVTADGAVVAMLRLTGPLGAEEYLDIDLERTTPRIEKVGSGTRVDAYDWLNKFDGTPVFDPHDSPRVRHTGGGTVVALYRRTHAV